ncbi:MAG: SCO family protein [Gammaproteobacteria bacterium]|nr:SCO family protein [Gammaproteobacteria bacterium]
MNIKRRLNQLLFAAVAAFSLALGYWYSQGSQQNQVPAIPSDFEATVFPEARDLVPFKLVDQDGKDFTPDNLKHKWSMLFFGFTHCPDVCPTTLKVLQEFKQELPADIKAKTGVVFVTVDPNRDTPAIIKEYVQYFEPSFQGVTGNLGHITAFTRSLGILYEYVSMGEGKNNYGVNHSGQIILIDPQARLRAVFPAPHDPDEMRRNFIKIVEFYRG